MKNVRKWMWMPLAWAAVALLAISGCSVDDGGGGGSPNDGSSLLSGLSVKSVGGEELLAMSFDPETTMYEIQVEHSIESVAILAEARDPAVKITYSVNLGADNSFQLEAGINSVAVTVASSGGDAKTYEIRILRASKVINIAILNSASNITYFTASALELSENPTYFAFESEGQINFEKLPANMMQLPGTGPGYPPTTAATVNDFHADKETAIAFAKNLYEQDAYTYFKFYFNEDYIENAFLFGTANGIPDRQYTVTYIYHAGWALSRIQTRYKETPAIYANDYAFAGDLIDAVNDIAGSGGGVDAVLEHIKESANKNGDYTPYEILTDYTVLPFLARMKNLCWWVDDYDKVSNAVAHDPALSELVADLIASKQIVEKNIPLLLQDAKARGRLDDILWMIKAKWGDGEEDNLLSLVKNNGKKNLMILGTGGTVEYPGMWSGGSTSHSQIADYPGTGRPNLEDYLNAAVERFGGEYNIYYKGHPFWPSTENTGRRDYLEEKGIVEFPSAIPAEFILYSVENMYVGGFNTSTFNSALPGTTLALFAIHYSDIIPYDNVSGDRFKGAEYWNWNGEGFNITNE
ncbi:MAG: cadherin-like beta sandwich domain-containing protein [Treponema sp.]|jgi:hypothetical protein|nr:cadherin-like beta sandwich domain-containing protein [Treponema sp.]